MFSAWGALRNRRGVLLHLSVRNACWSCLRHDGVSRETGAARTAPCNIIGGIVFAISLDQTRVHGQQIGSPGFKSYNEGDVCVRLCKRCCSRAMY